MSNRSLTMLADALRRRRRERRPSTSPTPGQRGPGRTSVSRNSRRAGRSLRKIRCSPSRATIACPAVQALRPSRADQIGNRSASAPAGADASGGPPRPAGRSLECAESGRLAGMVIVVTSLGSPGAVAGVDRRECRESSTVGRQRGLDGRGAGSNRVGVTRQVFAPQPNCATSSSAAGTAGAASAIDERRGRPRLHGGLRSRAGSAWPRSRAKVKWRGHRCGADREDRRARRGGSAG